MVSMSYARGVVFVGLQRFCLEGLQTFGMGEKKKHGKAATVPRIKSTYDSMLGTALVCSHWSVGCCICMQLLECWVLHLYAAAGVLGTALVCMTVCWVLHLYV